MIIKKKINLKNRPGVIIADDFFSTIISRFSGELFSIIPEK